MNVGTRIRTIRLIDKINKNKEFAESIGISSQSKEFIYQKDIRTKRKDEGNKNEKQIY